MKIAFHGAARTVTGSKHLITLNNGKKYLLDCGMFQGMGNETDGLNRDFGFDAADVDCLFSFIHFPWQVQQVVFAVAVFIKYLKCFLLIITH